MNFFRKPFRYTFLNATMILVAVNAVVYFITFNFPYSKLYLSLSYQGLRIHHYWQAVTYMFTHANWRHILFNMLALVCFGYRVERAIGSKEFLLFYFVTGILDGIISVFLYRFLGISVLLMGASGAIYAVLLAYAVIFPRESIFIWGLIRVPAPMLVAIYAAIEVAGQISGSSGTAYLSHLAGFALAWIYFVMRMGVNPIKVWKNAYQK